MEGAGLPGLTTLWPYVRGGFPGAKSLCRRNSLIRSWSGKSRAAALQRVDRFFFEALPRKLSLFRSSGGDGGLHEEKTAGYSFWKMHRALSFGPIQVDDVPGNAA